MGGVGKGHRSERAALAAIAAGLATGGPALADVQYSERIKRYEIAVTEESPEAVMRGVRRHGPLVGGREAIGAAQGRVSWETRFTRSPQRGCFLESATVKVDVTLLLPEWERMWRVSPPMQRYWACVEETVTTHERQHARIYRETGEQIDQALRVITGWMPCDEMHERIGSTARRINQAGEARQRTFDEEDYRRPRYEQCLAVSHHRQMAADRRPAIPRAAAASRPQPAEEAAPVRIDDGGLGTVVVNLSLAGLALLAAAAAYAGTMGLMIRTAARHEDEDEDKGEDEPDQSDRTGTRLPRGR